MNRKRKMLYSTNRIEAFSDGVFAIAITLLIIEIKVPQLHGADAAIGLPIRASFV